MTAAQRIIDGLWQGLVEHLGVSGPAPPEDSLAKWLQGCNSSTTAEASTRLAQTMVGAVAEHFNAIHSANAAGAFNHLGDRPDDVDDWYNPEFIGVVPDDANREARWDRILMNPADVPAEWWCVSDDTGTCMIAAMTGAGVRLLNHVHAIWCALPPDNQPQHPLVPILVAWADQPQDPDRRHIISPASLRATKGQSERALVRSPALLSLATLTSLEAVAVDGEPLVTRSPAPEDGRPAHRFRVRPDSQGDLFPGPRRIAGHPLGDFVLDTLAQYPLSGDERTNLRGDVLRLGQYVFALTGAVRFTKSDVATLLTGRSGVTDATERRIVAAMETLRFATYYRRDERGRWIGLPRPLAVVDYGEEHMHLAPPLWWREVRRHDGHVWRLSGGLFRPVVIDRTDRGTDVGYWATIARTIAGIEAALGYGPAAGRGRGGRIPDAFRPANGRSGPGPEIFIHWQTVLRLSGEHVRLEADGSSTESRRYRDRVEALRKAGYVVGPRQHSALAGDTIEIVRAQKGSKVASAGLVVRATARFVEAYKRSRKKESWERYPASKVLNQHEF